MNVGFVGIYLFVDDLDVMYDCDNWCCFIDKVEIGEYVLFEIEIGVFFVELDVVFCYGRCFGC